MTIQKHNDAEGWKRGLGHYSKDDPAFAKPKHSYDLPGVKHIKAKSDISEGAPGPVSRGGPPRYKAKTGPISNAKKPK